MAKTVKATNKTKTNSAKTKTPKKTNKPAFVPEHTFEYRVEHVSNYDWGKFVVVKLKELGLEGWELVNVVADYNFNSSFAHDIVTKSSIRVKSSSITPSSITFSSTTGYTFFFKRKIK